VAKKTSQMVIITDP